MKISIKEILNNTDKQREMEKESFRLMTEIYCHGKHHSRKGELCPECCEFLEFAREKTDRCPFMETGTSCSKCKNHCYSGKWENYVKDIMRYAGPRMLLLHPEYSLLHGMMKMKKKTSK